MFESLPLIHKAAKFAAIGLVIGLGASILFPPFGIAIIAISAIVSATGIAAKLAHTYLNMKREGMYSKGGIETNGETLSEIFRDLIVNKLPR